MYSVHLVEQLLAEDAIHDGRVLDPFCGTGTTALVCAERGVPCDTTDINPFLLWLAQAKTHSYTADAIATAREHAAAIVAAATDVARGREWVPPLSNIEKWWEPLVLDALSRAWGEISRRSATIPRPASWLLVVAFLRTAIRTARVSFGHQSMSFSRSGDGSRQLSLTEAREPASSVQAEWEAAISSVAEAAHSPVGTEPQVLHCDARELTHVLDRRSYVSVITSPPYCNRMSYIRELRPYMYWMKYLRDARAAGELDWQAIGGTWGTATSNLAKWEPDPSAAIPFVGFDRIVSGVSRNAARHSDILARYIAKYFHDTVLHARELFEVVQPEGAIHYIVGNSKVLRRRRPNARAVRRNLPSSGIRGRLDHDAAQENVEEGALRVPRLGRPAVAPGPSLRRRAPAGAR